MYWVTARSITGYIDRTRRQISGEKWTIVRRLAQEMRFHIWPVFLLRSCLAHHMGGQAPGLSLIGRTGDVNGAIQQSWIRLLLELEHERRCILREKIHRADKESSVL